MIGKTKEIHQYNEVRDKILAGLTKLSAPILQTLTPKGRNVIFQDDYGGVSITNDGFTIAKNITLDDPIENTICSIVKHSAIKTNITAGDGTSTSILLSDTLIREGFRLIDNGMNPMDLKRELEKVNDLLVGEIPKYTNKVSSKKDLEYVAYVASNNDKEIASNTADIIDKAKEDGLIFIEPNPSKDETKIVEELGFLLDKGMFSQHLANMQGRFVARYEDVPVLITDKRLYYEEEVIAILNKVAENGWNKVVIIANDFIGQAPNILIANHSDPKVNMQILMIKESDLDTIDDLASYLGGQIYTEKRGSMVKELKKEDFLIASRIISDMKRTIISSVNDKNVASTLRIKALRNRISEVDKGSPEEERLKRRIACMTNGVITIKVGGKTQIEANEKIFRYEDSINATRNALKSGFVVGGGITLWNLYKNLPKSKLNSISPDLRDVVKRFCESSLRQIGINCNVPFSSLMENINGKVVGYNAITGKFENLLEAGVIEPVIVLKVSIENSISVAGVILSSDYIIINKKDEDEENR